MPEGDTIFKTARTLERALSGKRVVASELPRRGVPVVAAGTLVAGVEARGKHLLIRFEGTDRVLHTHMQMSGSWHVYRPGEPWRRARGAARALLEVEDAVAVCFSTPVVELLPERVLRAHPSLSTLGPDLCAASPDLDEALRRLDALVAPATPVAVALLDQRVAAGIGNVYKSEVLFACRVDPLAPVGELDAATRRRLLETAARLLRANAERPGPRRTSADGRAVYGRGGRPCPRCRTPIERAHLGEPRRVTYRCPSCQPSRMRAAS